MVNLWWIAVVFLVVIFIYLWVLLGRRISKMRARNKRFIMHLASDVANLLVLLTAFADTYVSEKYLTSPGSCLSTTTYATSPSSCETNTCIGRHDLLNYIFFDCYDHCKLGIVIIRAVITAETFLKTSLSVLNKLNKGLSVGNDVVLCFVPASISMGASIVEVYAAATCHMLINFPVSICLLLINSYSAFKFAELELAAEPLYESDSEPDLELGLSRLRTLPIPFLTEDWAAAVSIFRDLYSKYVEAERDLIVCKNELIAKTRDHKKSTKEIEEYKRKLRATEAKLAKKYVEAERDLIACKNKLIAKTRDHTKLTKECMDLIKCFDLSEEEKKMLRDQIEEYNRKLSATEAKLAKKIAELEGFREPIQLKLKID